MGAVVSAQSVGARFGVVAVVLEGLQMAYIGDIQAINASENP